MDYNEYRKARPEMTQEEVMNYWQHANKGYGYTVWRPEHDFTEQKETKMTREEAKSIWCKNKYDMIDTLEALGLLRFEEKKTICGIPLETVIDTLRRDGYTIIRNKL